jgi:hypothetical protein
MHFNYPMEVSRNTGVMCCLIKLRINFIFFLGYLRLDLVIPRRSKTEANSSLKWVAVSCSVNVSLLRECLHKGD